MEQGAATASVGLDELEQAPFETLPAGHIVRGRYEIRSVLGAGGYSAVYLAYDRDLHSEVALKILRRDVVSLPRERGFRAPRKRFPDRRADSWSGRFRPSM